MEATDLASRDLVDSDEEGSRSELLLNAAAKIYAQSDQTEGLLILDVSRLRSLVSEEDPSPVVTQMMANTSGVMLPDMFQRSYVLQRDIPWSSILGFDLGDVDFAVWSFEETTHIVQDSSNISQFLSASPRWSQSGSAFTNQGGWDTDFDLDEVEARIVDGVESIRIDGDLIILSNDSPITSEVPAAGGDTAVALEEAIRIMLSEESEMGWFLRGSDHREAGDPHPLRKNVQWAFFTEKVLNPGSSPSNESHLHIEFESAEDAEEFSEDAPRSRDDGYIAGQLEMEQEESLVTIDFPDEDRGVLLEARNSVPPNWVLMWLFD